MRARRHGVQCGDCSDDIDDSLATSLQTSGRAEDKYIQTSGGINAVAVEKTLPNLLETTTTRGRNGRNSDTRHDSQGAFKVHDKTSDVSGAHAEESPLSPLRRVKRSYTDGSPVIDDAVKQATSNEDAKALLAARRVSVAVRHEVMGERPLVARNNTRRVTLKLREETMEDVRSSLLSSVASTESSNGELGGQRRAALRAATDSMEEASTPSEHCTLPQMSSWPTSACKSSDVSTGAESANAADGFRRSGDISEELKSLEQALRNIIPKGPEPIKPRAQTGDAITERASAKGSKRCAGRPKAGQASSSHEPFVVEQFDKDAAMDTGHSGRSSRARTKLGACTVKEELALLESQAAASLHSPLSTDHDRAKNRFPQNHADHIDPTSPRCHVASGLFVPMRRAQRTVTR